MTQAGKSHAPDAQVAGGSADSATGPSSSLAAFRHPVFRSIWIASMASNFGGMIQSVGASWMMTSISGSAEMVALVQSSVTLPIMLLALLSGAVADNFDRKRIMLGAQTFMLAVSLALAACAWAGWITPWLLLVFTFLIGCGAAMNGPAWQASVGDMVPRRDLPGAVALNSMGFNVARSLGPAIGGAVVAAAGAAAAFAINAMSYVALIGVLFRWRPDLPRRTLPRERLIVAIGAGIRYGWMSPAISVVLVRALLFGLGASSLTAMMPLVARDLIDGGPLTYGLLLGSFGGGAIIGALTVTRLRQLLTPEGLVRWACVAIAAAALSVAISRSLPFTMAALVMGGAGWVLALSTFNVTVQLNSPRWVVARALSLYQMAAFGGMAAGSWMLGMVAEARGVPTALTAAAVLLVIAAAAGLKLPVPMLRDLNLDPLREWRPPETELEIQPRSGPVVITVEYRIREQDLPDFLDAMSERRRVRRRDGARRWTLLRDLAEPEVWIERFHLANWIEYIRHNNRITQADIGAVDIIRALHQGPETPRVRRMIERPARSIMRRGDEGELRGAMTDPAGVD